MTIQAGFVRRWAYVPVLLALSASLAACGGGVTTAGGGTGGTGISTGSVTAFGSVWVNGVEYRTDAATIRKRLDDGMGNIPGEDNAVFRRGMVVTVRHGLSDNNAMEIDYQSNVLGPIFAKNLADNTIVVLGQTVRIDAGTWLYDDMGTPLASFADLRDNNVVEVSGFADNNGLLHATFLERKRAIPEPDEEFEIKGYVSGLDNAAKTFRIGPTPGSGNILVTYNGSTAFGDMPNGFDNGLYVEVKTMSSGGPGIAATAIEGKSDTAGEAKAGDAVTIEGYPAGIDPAGGKFSVDGVRVSAAGAQYSPSGKGFSDIAATTKVRAEGTFAGGELAASKITFE